MQKFSRSISVDVCDYTNKPLCNLFSSGNEVSGQAVDVFVRSERNGTKELRFKLPSTMLGEDGYEENFRLKYLVSDYRIKFQHKKTNGTIETDWFLLSESRVTHNQKQKNYEIVAKHISSLLRTKNLDLEFSDTEGNNVGTIKQIAETILEGTGWHLGEVATFYEEDKYSQGQQIEKVRSFTASAKTGAFKMMSDLCELFDAKPIYHGEGAYEENNVQKIGRTVDIIPMNPFSEDLEEGAIPEEVLLGENVLALYYDKNIRNITRTMNTDNLITKLTAYGSYGDRNGLCSLQNAEHSVITFGSLPAGTYRFLFQNGYYFFTTTKATNGLKWSYLDFVSRSYVYDGTNLFKVFRDAPASYTTITGTTTTEKNYFPYIMDFSYYQKIGLLTDEMLLALARHQTEVPQQHITATEASYALSSAKDQLMQKASTGNGFLMLDISNSRVVDGNVVLTINKNNYSDGVIYRSDYDEAKRNYFAWRVASNLNNQGQAVSDIGSVVYIVNQGNPTKWVKAYVKAYGDGTDNYYADDLGNTYNLHTKREYASKSVFPAIGNQNYIYVAQDDTKMYTWFNNDYIQIHLSDFEYGFNKFAEPNTITLWTSVNNWNKNSKVYLFSADSIAGLFGAVEDTINALRDDIVNTTKIATEMHPLYFLKEGDAVPACPTQSYGWYYRSYEGRYSLGDLYFCWGKNGDEQWNKVTISRGNENPEMMVATGSKYYYSIPRKMLYKAETMWIPVKGTVDNDKLTAHFAVVLNGCAKQEILSKGVLEEYSYTGNTTLPVGNYAFKNEYDQYWLFTTTQQIRPGTEQLRYVRKDKIVWQDQDDNHIVPVIESPYDKLEFPVINQLTGVLFSDSGYNNGVFDTATTYKASNSINVHDNTEYEFSLPVNSIVVCLDTNNRLTGEFKSSPMVTPNNTTHIRVVANSVPTTSHYFRVKNYTTSLFYANKRYTIIPCQGVGVRDGMNVLMDQFIELAHDAYQVRLPALTAAQNAIKQSTTDLMEALGDMYREGVWQETKYVEGDESKLYSDALDNLKEVAKPETTYDFTYLDLYGSDENLDADVEVDWPDIEITDAAHLVDSDLDTNCWAYIDVVDKCYDQPWRTEIEINTRLSMIGQQSFTDVLTRIAEVANEVKANQSVYKRAAVLTGSGKLAADRLEGAIQANKVYLLGGTSNWYTDDKGNIIFEASDGNSAMMLTGRGLCIANTKDIYGDWDWRTAVSGLGINADAIYTGYLSAERIEAGSITTDKLSASVGQELEISSNKALLLYSTVDGVRPAGGVRTPTVREGDSYIEIAAKNGNNPAYINIMTGGVMNVYSGSEMNIQSGGEMNVKSNGDLNVESGGDIVVKNGGSIDVNTGGDINVTAGGKLNVAASDIMLTSTLSFEDQHNSDNQTVIREYRLSTKRNDITGDYPWTAIIPTATDAAPYVWSRDHTITYGGTHKYSTPILESGLGAMVDETYREYIKTAGNDPSHPPAQTASGWGKTIPIADSNNPYVWVRTVTIKKDGTVVYGTPELDTELSNMSAARIWSNNVASGAVSVPYVESTGIKIKGNELTVGATGEVKIIGNKGVSLYNKAGNNAIQMNGDGISIASSSNIAIASGATLSLDADRIILKGTGHNTTITSALDNEVVESIRTYKAGNSESTAPSLTQANNKSKDNTWTETIPVVSTSVKYLWSRVRTTRKNGVIEYGTAVKEGVLSSVTETVHKEYLRNNSTTAPAADASGWVASLPAPTKDATGKQTNPYVWVCDAKTRQNGTKIRENIHRDEGLENLSGASITASNVATGLESVPWVKTTGLEIDGNNVKLTAVDKMLIAANTELKIENASGNNLMKLSPDGISIATAKDMALVAGGKLQFGTGTNLFTVGSSGTTGYIYNGRTSISDTTHDGIYLGTNGINIGKANGNHVIAKSDGTIDVTGSITATSFTLSTGVTIPYTSVNGLTNAGVSYTYAVSTSGTSIPTSGWNATRPTNVTKGQYVWTKAVTTNLNGSTSTQYAVEYYSKDGTNGKDGADGKYIKSMQLLYYLGNGSKPSKPTTSTSIASTDVKNQWTTIIPKWAEGYTYYQSAKMTYSDNSVVFADVITDYGLTESNKHSTEALTSAEAAATTVEPFTHDGLSYGLLWGGKEYGVVLSNKSSAKRMLIGSNSGITIAKSAASGDGAALSIDSSGIGMYASTFVVKTSANATTNVVAMDTSGITLASGGKIEIKSGSSFTVESDKFNIDTSGNVKITGQVNATSGSIAGWTINSASLTGNKTGLAKTTNDTDIAIWAGNTTANSANFRVTQGGSMTATSGSIAGWTINSTYFYGNTTGMAKTTNGTDVAFWAGKDYANRGTASFRVTQAGTLTATSGSIAGWTIGSTSLTGNKTGMAKTTNDSDYAFWAGNATASSANFRVTQSGALTATSATISGDITATTGSIGGWNISENWLYHGKGANCVTLLGSSATAGSTNLYAMYAGADWPEAVPSGGTGTGWAPFRVKRSGDVYMTKGHMTSGEIGTWNVTNDYLWSGSGATNVCLVGTTSVETGNVKNYAFYAGASWPESTGEGVADAPFRVKRDGTAYMTSGKIGTWNVSSDYLYNGSGTNTVCLVGTTASTTGNVKNYAIYVGADWPESTGEGVIDAPFRVKRNGDVYLNQLMIWDGTKYVPVDFSKDFSNAVSYSSGSWSGNTFKATLSFFNGKASKSVNISTSIAIVSAKILDAGQKGENASGSITTRLTVGSAQKPDDTFTEAVRIDARPAYKDGWNRAEAQYTSLGNRFWGYYENGWHSYGSSGMTLYTKSASSDAPS